MNRLTISFRTLSGNPLFCGGEYNLGECWEYDIESDVYRNYQEPMNGFRRSSAYVEMADGTFWIMGGQDPLDV